MHFPSAVDFHGDNLKKADKSAMDMQLFGGGNRLVWVVVYRDHTNSDVVWCGKQGTSTLELV